VRQQIFRFFAVAGLVVMSALLVLLLPTSPKKSQLIIFGCSDQSCRQMELPVNSQPENMPDVDYDFSLDLTSCPPEGVFKTGEIDLTGDGRPELVSLIEGRISVIKEGQEIWASDPTWQVTDLTLGDPNDDGRFNILSVVWIEDEQGTAFCHPYMFGYRGGSVRLIWGGSAAIYPLQEVLLADIDGDGNQELIVIEAVDKDYKPGSGTGLSVVSVWDWRGWHYSLRWKSDPAHYSRLSCAYLKSPVENKGHTVVITVNRTD
jgi:hypothetical protein